MDRQSIPGRSFQRGILTNSTYILQRIQSEAVLKQLQEHPDAWTRVDAILEQTKNQQTKFYGLQVRRIGWCVCDCDYNWIGLCRFWRV